MENVYSREPLQVTLYDVPTGSPVRSYMFLGNAPAAVLAAASRGVPAPPPKKRTSAWPTTTWNKADSALLQKHYGPRWDTLLTPRVGAAFLPATGGFDFEDLNDESGARPADEGGALPAEEAEGEAPGDARTVYCDQMAYPEDTIADLKLKIYAATGIAPYRQHIFYITDRGDDIESDGQTRTVHTSYRLSVEHRIVPVDIRRFSQGFAGKGDEVAGVPVDRRLEERRDDVRVDPTDSFITLEESPGVNARRVFVADFGTVVRGREADLRKAMGDKYQFDLLYYGAVLKFWPALSQEAFRLAVVQPRAVAAEFPALAPGREKTQERCRSERAFLDAVYKQAGKLDDAFARTEKSGGIAVTEASATVEPLGAKMPVNIRNVFDWLATGPSMPAVVARVPADALGNAGRSRRDLRLVKTHVVAAAPRTASALSRFYAAALHRPAVSCAIAREAAGRQAEGTAPQFVYFTLYDDGRYTVESSWREDFRVGFSEAFQQFSGAVLPVIAVINGMGAAALPLGGQLEAPAEANARGRVSLGTLTASVFWPASLTTAGFSLMKDAWRGLERAGVIGVRGLQQAGAYSFAFRKGIVAGYDARALDKNFAGLAAGATNHYAYLTDQAAAQRWAQTFSGRAVRVFHRTTDVRLEVAGTNMAEFRRFCAYAFALLGGLPQTSSSKGSSANEGGGRLRALQERDPDLYDLKKFDENATVYSILCQGDRQPEIVSEADAKPGSKVVRFWNFTEKKPAYYRCPSARFPHLSFRAGEHPLGYCLPCCKKLAPLAGTKSHAVNTRCVQDYRLVGEDADIAADDPLALARHVLAYGKDAAPGRIAYLPQILSEGVFFHAIEAPYVFRLISVAQQAPGFPDAGFFYAIAAGLSLEPEPLARMLAETALAVSESFRSLASGGAAVFASADDLAAAIVEAFVTGGSFSPFGPGGAAEETWTGIVSDLVYIRFDIEIAVFADAAGDGGVYLEMSPSASRHVSLPGAALDLIVMVRNPAGTFLLAAMDQREFTRHAGGRGPARRFFSSAYEEGEPGDEVVSLVREMATSAMPGDLVRMGLEDVLALCAERKFVVVYRLINLHDLCYGVVIAPDPAAPDDWAYFPLPNSPHFLPPQSDTRSSVALYGPRPPGKYAAAAIARVVSGSAIHYIARLTAPGGSVVGFIASFDSGEARYFFHDPVAAAGAAPYPWASAPDAPCPYDMGEVDREIYKAGGVPSVPLPSDKVAIAARGLRRNNQYRLFLAEFAALIREERDLALREKVLGLVRGTRFTSPSSISAFNQNLAQLVPDRRDADSILSIVSALYARVGPRHVLAAFKDAFNASVFGFDHSTLSRLRALGSTAGRKAVAAELATLMAPRVVVGEPAGSAPGVVVANSAAAEPANIYTACSISAAGQQFCSGSKLAVMDSFADLCDILSVDVLNPNKTSDLAALAAGVIDGGRFISRPGERIVIS